MIYFIQQNKNGPVKIGYTENLRARISGIQVSNPCTLTLLGTVSGSKHIERQIHQHLRYYHVGGEWFRASSFVLEYIFSLPNYKPDHLDDPRKKKEQPIISLSSIKVAEKELIIKILKKYKNNKSHTAIALEMSRSTLYQKIKKYNLQSRF